MIPVVGLDLSLTATGLATAAGCRTVKSKGPDDATLRERHDRLHGLAALIGLHIGEAAGGRTALVVIEQPAYNQTGGSHHDRSGLWWLVIDELFSAGHIVAEVAPTSLKKYITGRGNAGKDEVLLAVARRFSDVDVRDNNQADALVLRAMGLAFIGRPIVELPAAQAEVVTKVRWPRVVLATEPETAGAAS